MNVTPETRQTLPVKTAVLSGVILLAFLLVGLAGAGAPATATAQTETDTAVYLPVMMYADRGPCRYYDEGDGKIIIEIEAAPATSSWAVSTDIGGYTGTSFYRWKGPNHYPVTEAGDGLLEYPIWVSETGRYQFRIRNHTPPEWTEENDVWVKLNEGPWVKGYSWRPGFEPYDWNWTFNYDLSHTNRPEAYMDLTAGYHTIYLSGRSHNFTMDRMILYLDVNDPPTNPALPQSPCVVPTTPPDWQ